MCRTHIVDQTGKPNRRNRANQKKTRAYPVQTFLIVREELQESKTSNIHQKSKRRELFERSNLKGQTTQTDHM